MQLRRIFSLLIVFALLTGSTSPLLAQDGSTDQSNPKRSNRRQATPEFTTFTTDDGYLTLEIPAEWDDIYYDDWYVDDEVVGVLLEVSSDLDAFYGDLNVPGFNMGLSKTLLDETGGQSYLDSLDLSDFCTLNSEEVDESDEALTINGEEVAVTFRGKFWEECGESDSTIVQVVAVPEDESFLFFIDAQFLTEEESDQIGDVLDTMEIGDLSSLVGSPQSEQTDDAPDDSSDDSTDGSTDEATDEATTSESTADGTGLSLRLNLEEGATYRTRMLTDQLIEQSLPTNDQTLEQQLGIEYRFIVDAVDSQGNADVSVIYDWVMFEQQGPFESVRYDSDNPPAEVPPAAIGYAALVGQGFNMRLAPDGTVLNVSGVDNLLEGMIEGLDLPSGPEADAIIDTLRSQFGEDALKATLEQMTSIYPEEPVAIDESWSREFIIDFGFPMILNNSWTLREYDDEVALLDVEATMEPNPNAEPLDMGIAELDFELSGSQSGSMEIDLESGWTVRAEIVQSFAGDLSADGITIPMSVESIMSIDGSIEYADTDSDSDDAVDEDVTDEEDVDDEDAIDEDAVDEEINNEAQSTNDTKSGLENKVGINIQGPTKKIDIKGATSNEANESNADEANEDDSNQETADADDSSEPANAEEADPTADDLIDQGIEFYDADELEEAIALFSEAIELDPQSVRAFVWRGDAHKNLDLYEESIDDYTAAIEIDQPDYSYQWAYGNRGISYYFLDDYDRAIADASRAVTLDSSYTLAYYLRGISYKEKGNYQKAVDDFTTALELDDPDYNYKWTYFERGESYAELAEYEKAIADFTEVIALDPEYTWAYEERGYAYRDMGMHEEAIEALTEAIDLQTPDHNYQWTYAARGIAHYRLDEFEACIDDLSEAIEIDSEYTWAFEWRGYCQYEVGAYEDAVDDFTTALTLDQPDYNYQWVYGNRGNSYYELGENENAIDDLTLALEMDPEFTWAYENRAKAYRANEQYEEAIADLTTAIELEDSGWDYIETYALRGYVYGDIDEYEAAIEDFRTASSLDPADSSGWNRLCWYGSLYGYAEDVLDEACDLAVALAPESDMAFYQDSRGVARALTGDVDGAIEDFKAFLDGFGTHPLREEWVERLEAGEDPADIFDAETLEYLENEDSDDFVIEEEPANEEPADDEPTDDEPADDEPADESSDAGTSDEPTDESSDADYINFPDVGVSLRQPDGFVEAADFFGFGEEESQSSIAITRLPGPYDAVTAGFTEEGLDGAGMTLIDSEEMLVNELSGMLLNVTQEAGGITFEKWILVFGDEDATTLVTATFPLDQSDEFSEPLKEIILDLDLIDVEPTDPDDLLDFTLVPSEKLQAAETGMRALVYTKDGVMPAASPTDPLFVAAPSLGDAPVEDQDEFARQRYSQIEDITISSVEFHQPITIDGLDGYETIGFGEDISDETALLVYQVILFDGDAYIVMQGMVGEDQGDEYLPEFSTMSRSFERK